MKHVVKVRFKRPGWTVEIGGRGETVYAAWVDAADRLWRTLGNPKAGWAPEWQVVGFEADGVVWY